MHRHKGGHDVDWHWEDDRAVVLCRDAVQGLQVTKLEQTRFKIGLFVCLSNVNKHNVRFVCPVSV